MRSPKSCKTSATIYQGTLGTRARGGGYDVVGDIWFKVYHADVEIGGWL